MMSALRSVKPDAEWLEWGAFLLAGVDRIADVDLGRQKGSTAWCSASSERPGPQSAMVTIRAVPR